MAVSHKSSALTIKPPGHAMMSDQEETNKIYKLTKIVCLEMYFTAVGSCGRRMTHDSGIINEHITVTVFYQ